MMLRIGVLALVALVGWGSTAQATDHFVAPVGATSTCVADGSQACPWPSIAAAFGSTKIAAGDTVLLMDGDHGSLFIKYQAFSSPVTIRSQNGRKAHLDFAEFANGNKNIALKSVSIWRKESDSSTLFLIKSYEDSSFLTFEDIDMRSREDGANNYNWSQTRWRSVSTDGFLLLSTNNVVRNNTLQGVNVGIVVEADSLVEGNLINGYSGDGMKAGTRTTIRNNTILNSFAANPDYHRDGFQSYTPGPPVVGLVIEGNKFIQWTYPGSHPLKNAVQGIGMYDGFYDDLIIRNNLIVSQHSHGISVYGTRRAVIANNTVVNLDGVASDIPWIGIFNHKNGQPSQDVVVANNLAMQFVDESNGQNNVKFTNNSVIFDPKQVFEDVASFNYIPKPTSGFIDNGIAAYAPPTDIRNAPRPAGVGPDRGAYEYGATVTGSVSPEGGTTLPPTDPATSEGTTTTTVEPVTTNGTTTSGGTTTTIPSTGAKFVKPPKRKKREIKLAKRLLRKGS